jgi:hypothetical protein
MVVVRGREGMELFELESTGLYAGCDCHLSKRHLGDARRLACMLTGDKVAVVTEDAVIGHAVVDGGGAAAVVVPVALGGLRNFSGPSGRRMLPPTNRSFNLVVASTNVCP